MDGALDVRDGVDDSATLGEPISAGPACSSMAFVSPDTTQ